MIATLTPTARAGMSVQVLARLEALDRADFGPVMRGALRKMQMVGMPLRLENAEAELALKQFYALSAANPEASSFAVSSVVDEYWHAHILDTAAYRRFCEKIYGGFMDHVPLDKDKTVDVLDVKALYRTTHSELTRLFGSSLVVKAFPPEPTDEVIVCVCQNNCCNQSTC